MLTDRQVDSVTRAFLQNAEYGRGVFNVVYDEDVERRRPHMRAALNKLFDDALESRCLLGVMSVLDDAKAARRELHRFEHVEGEPLADMAAIATVAYDFLESDRDYWKRVVEEDDLVRYAVVNRKPGAGFLVNPSWLAGPNMWIAGPLDPPTAECAGGFRLKLFRSKESAWAWMKENDTPATFCETVEVRLVPEAVR